MWALEVQDRLHGCIDLVAAEAVYHDIMLSKQLDAAPCPSSVATLWST